MSNHKHNTHKNKRYHGSTNCHLSAKKERLPDTQSELLLRYCVSGIVEDLFDLRQGDDLGVVVDMDGPGRDVNLDLTDTFQFPNGPFNRVLAMFARNVGSHKSCRFHQCISSSGNNAH